MIREIINPFYVGVTKIRLDYRLAQHFRETKIYKQSTDHGIKKAIVMQDIAASGNQVVIKTVFVCRSEVGVLCESCMYHVLTDAGEVLHQSINKFQRNGLKLPH